LTPAKFFQATYCLKRLLEGGGVIATVVYDRLSISVEDAHRVRHLVWPDHVAAAHLRGLDIQLRRDKINEALHYMHGFRAPGPTVGRVRHFVRRCYSCLDRLVLDLVRTAQVGYRV